MKVSRWILGLAALSLVVALPVQAETVSATITFDGNTCNDPVETCTAGVYVDEINGVSTSGPVGFVGVLGTNDGPYPGNVGCPVPNYAMIFDSNSPSGGDDDLGSPNETCTVPGPGSGPDGEEGETYENCPANGGGDYLNNLLIITENCDPSDPDDADNPGETLNFDFTTITSPWVPEEVRVLGVSFLDVEQTQGESATVKLYEAGDSLCLSYNIPSLGDNGLFDQNAPVNSCNVAKMEIDLGGSGAIDNVLFSIWREDQGGEGCTPGYWKNHDGSLKKNGRSRPDAWYNTGFDPADLIDTVFVAAVPYDSPNGKNLKDGLQFKGGQGVEGAVRILLRAAIAALLNAGSPNVSYVYSVSDVITNTNAALASGDRVTMLTWAADFDFNNNAGCPLGNNP